MPKFKFVGQFTGDSEVMDAFGYKFAGDKPVDVPESDEKTLEKLRGNKEFEEVGAKAEKADSASAAKARSEKAASEVEAKRLAEEEKNREEDDSEPPVGVATTRNMDQVGRQEAADMSKVGQDGKVTDLPS